MKTLAIIITLATLTLSSFSASAASANNKMNTSRATEVSARLQGDFASAEVASIETKEVKATTLADLGIKKLSKSDLKNNNAPVEVSASN